VFCCVVEISCSSKLSVATLSLKTLRCENDDVKLMNLIFKGSEFKDSKKPLSFFFLLHYLQCWPKLGTLAMGGSQAAVDSSGAARSPIRPRIPSRPSSATGWNFGGGRLVRLMVSRKIGQGSYGRALAGALMAGHPTGGHGELSGIREQPEI
jgi:hypothetical protein